MDIFFEFFYYMLLLLLLLFIDGYRYLCLPFRNVNAWVSLLPQNRCWQTKRNLFPFRDAVKVAILHQTELNGIQQQHSKLQFVINAAIVIAANEETVVSTDRKPDSTFISIPKKRLIKKRN